MDYMDKGKLEGKESGRNNPACFPKVHQVNEPQSHVKLILKAMVKWSYLDFLIDLLHFGCKMSPAGLCVKESSLVQSSKLGLFKMRLVGLWQVNRNCPICLSLLFS